MATEINPLSQFRLTVGSKTFRVTWKTLSRFESIISESIRDNPEQRELEFDANPEVFNALLHYMRRQRFLTSDIKRYGWEALKGEADYFSLDIGSFNNKKDGPQPILLKLKEEGSGDTQEIILYKCLNCHNFFPGHKPVPCSRVKSGICVHNERSDLHRINLDLNFKSFREAEMLARDRRENSIVCVMVFTSTFILIVPIITMLNSVFFQVSRTVEYLFIVLCYLTFMLFNLTLNDTFNNTKRA